MLIEFSNCKMQSAGSWLPAHSGSQLKEGLEPAKHADWVLKFKVKAQHQGCLRTREARSRKAWKGPTVFELGQSKLRIKVACPLRRPDQGRLGRSQPRWFGFQIGTAKAQDRGCLPAQEARSRKAWKEPTMLIGTSNWKIQSAGSRLPANSGSQIEEGLEGANQADWGFEL